MERQITSGTKLLLDPTAPSIDEATPLFAINWFNTRALWLYNLYNLIAARSVFGVDGKVLFKGKIKRTLLGPSEFSRQMLLIVNYPNSERFLDMLSNRFFQITSLLRMAAVRDFSFVLNQRADGPTLLDSKKQTFESSSHWLVHHYSSTTPLDEEVTRIRKLLTDSPITLHFASEPAAKVYTIDRKDARTPLPAITDRVVILEARATTSIEDAIKGPYSPFIESVQDSYIGEVARSM